MVKYPKHLYRLQPSKIDSTGRKELMQWKTATGTSDCWTSRLRLANRIDRQHPGLIHQKSHPTAHQRTLTRSTPQPHRNIRPRSDYYNTMQLSAPPRFAREQNLGFLNEFEATDTMVIAQRMDNNHPGYMTAPQDVLPLQPTPMTSMTGQIDTNEHRTHSPTTTYHILTAINVLADDESQYTTDTHVNVGFHQETQTVTETITIHHQQGQQRTIEQIVATRNPDMETHTHTFSAIEQQAPRNETPDWDESDDDELNLHITDDERKSKKSTRTQQRMTNYCSDTRDSMV